MILSASTPIQRSESGVGQEGPLSVFSSPHSDLQSEGQLPRERKEMFMYSSSQLKQAAPPLLIVLVSLAFLPLQAVVPPPDGGYPGGNTAEGQKALLSLTGGVHNTAIGFLSLETDAAGNFNTAVGSGTLWHNTADANTATGAFALLL